MSWLMKECPYITGVGCHSLFTANNEGFGHSTTVFSLPFEISGKWCMMLPCSKDLQLIDKNPVHQIRKQRSANLM